jgi:class 3 adenylate cyclase
VKQGPTPIAPPRWSGEGLVLAFAGPQEAAQAAMIISAALKDVASATIGGHYGVMLKAGDPFGAAGDLYLGAAASLPARILASTPPGAVQVSEDFAAALYAGPAEGRPRAEYIGDLAGPEMEDDLRLFSLKP